jgi:two-component system sensor histidine kinase PilS (NtrC family)
LEAIGRIWWDLFSWGEIKNQYQTLALSGIPQRFEGEILKRDGGTTAAGGATAAGGHCFLGATISPLRNDQGETIGVIGIFQDLTKLKMMEEEMYQKRWLASIGEMAAGMAHEIRNPLASLSGSIQLLKKEPSLLLENQRLMDIALHEIDRLNAIITEFLLYAKPLPPRRKWVSIDQLLSESMEFIQKSKEAAQSTQIVLKMSEPPSFLFADPDQMKQVFWNLAMNAFAAMPQGGTLTLTTKQTSSMRDDNANGEEAIEFYFQDTGAGISKEDLPKIFYPFFTTKSSGSGLGLPIVQRIIEQHHGAIGVESSPAGTTFKIVIPIHPKGVDC